MGWGSAIGFTALGAGIIIGAEAIYGASVISKLQTSSNTVGGYQLRLIENPRSAGHVAPIGVILLQNGQPVKFATVSLTIAQKSGTTTGSVITDTNGIGVFSVLAQNPQTVTVTATYKSASGTTVTDVLDVPFAASVTAGS